MAIAYKKLFIRRLLLEWRFNGVEIDFHKDNFEAIKQ